MVFFSICTKVAIFAPSVRYGHAEYFGMKRILELNIKKNLKKVWWKFGGSPVEVRWKSGGSPVVRVSVGLVLG